MTRVGDKGIREFSDGQVKHRVSQRHVKLYHDRRDIALFLREPKGVVVDLDGSSTQLPGGRLDLEG